MMAVLLCEISRKIEALDSIPTVPALLVPY